MRLGVLLTASLLLGCAGWGERGEPAMERSEHDHLAASMEVKVSASAVRLILHVTNSGEAPVDLTFPSSQRHEFVVTTPSGEEVWRWSEGMAFMQALSSDTLAPGESWHMEAIWDPGERRGEFVAIGELTARDRDLRQRTTFEL